MPTRLEVLLARVVAALGVSDKADASADGAATVTLTQGIAALVVGLTLLHLAGATMTMLVTRDTKLWVRNAKKVHLSPEVPRSHASQYIRNVGNLPDYEQKVTKAVVNERRSDCTYYTLSGWWFGMPWKATFNMRWRDDGGFDSVVVKPPVGWARRLVASLIYIDGGFSLSGDDDGSTWVCHYENYGWPVLFPFLWAVIPIWRHWHLRGMQEEMGVIKQAMELSWAVEQAKLKATASDATGTARRRAPRGKRASSVGPARAGVDSDDSDDTAGGTVGIGNGDVGPEMKPQEGHTAGAQQAVSTTVDAAEEPSPSVPWEASAEFRARKYDGGDFIKEQFLCTPYVPPHVTAESLAIAAR